MSLTSIDLPIGNIGDLTVPTATQQYTLGREVTVVDSDKLAVKKFVYVYAPGALTQYVPYNISNTQASGKEVVAIAPVTTSGAVCLVGVPQVAFTSGYYGFVQTMGNLTAVLTATSLGTAGCAYELRGAGTTLVNTTGIIQTRNSVAFLVTTTSGASGSMYMPGYRVEISS
jgi:hypothetical protein